MAVASQWALEAAGLVSATMMTLIDTVPGALLLIAAGVYQFTPLKAACLSQCRSPAEFITRRKRPGTSGAFVMGLEHGAYCLGCCWFLMALLFVGGIMNLYWIVGLAALVALEKLTPFGVIAGKIAGAALIVWGGFVLSERSSGPRLHHRIGRSCLSAASSTTSPPERYESPPAGRRPPEQEARSRALRLSAAARSNSARASAARPARSRKSPLAAGSGA